MPLPFDSEIYWAGGEQRTTQRDAYIVMRVFVRLSEIIERELSREHGDHVNAWALCRIVGRLQVAVYGGVSIRAFEEFEKEEQLV